MNVKRFLSGIEYILNIKRLHLKEKNILLLFVGMSMNFSDVRKVHHDLSATAKCVRKRVVKHAVLKTSLR